MNSCVALLLVEVGDFGALRREAGMRGSAELLARLVASLRAACLQGEVELVGRSRIEVVLVAVSRSALDEAIEQVRAAVRRFPSAAAPLRLCTGVAVAPGGTADDPALYDIAEAALAHDRQDRRQADDDAFTAEELDAAIARDELVLHYQPKLHVRRQAIASIEALVRWQHPTLGLIPPGDFIPVAERSGAIGPLTLWTLHRVVADQRALQAAGHDLPVFVNIAGALLSDTGFITAVLALVRESGAKLGFEITETSVIREPERAIDHLNQLAAIGVTIAIDDYGAGLSSLAYLKQLPARELKIDKLFVTQLASSNRDPLIVRSTIDLAHALEMEVVAEGVETPTSLALLAVMGCDLVQGYLISRPLPLEALVGFLKADGHRHATEQARSPFGHLSMMKKSA